MELAITKQQLLDMRPCWDSERLEAFLADLPDRPHNATEILRLSGVPAGDKLWVVLREELISSADLRLFAADCAERALSRVESPGKASIAAVAAARRFARGEVSSADLSAARYAAEAAARPAARYASGCAARHAAESAAKYAAGAAANDAVRYASGAAAGSAARGAAESTAWAATRYASGAASGYDAWHAAERAWQVEHLIAMLEQS
jgi:hypothetical protein